MIKMARRTEPVACEDRDRRHLSKKIRFLAPPNYIIHDCAERVLSTVGGIRMPSAAGDCVAQGARARVIASRFLLNVWSGRVAAPTNVRSWKSNGLNADIALVPFINPKRK